MYVWHANAWIEKHVDENYEVHNLKIDLDARMHDAV